jgi:hypothetical protein
MKGSQTRSKPEAITRGDRARVAGRRPGGVLAAEQANDPSHGQRRDGATALGSYEAERVSGEQLES